MISYLMDWWGRLEGFELILWCIALFFSLLFLVQTLFSFAFGGDHSDIDTVDDDGHSFFTIRNLIAFFTMFGWAGLASFKGGLPSAAVILIALVAGLSMVGLLYLLMRQSARLRHNGTFQIANSINKIGETYLRIPAARGGLGKIQVQVQGRLTELDAMTDEPVDIPTGKPIRVVQVLNPHVVIVSSSMQF